MGRNSKYQKQIRKNLNPIKINDINNNNNLSDLQIKLERNHQHNFKNNALQNLKGSKSRASFLENQNSLNRVSLNRSLRLGDIALKKYEFRQVVPIDIEKRINNLEFLKENSNAQKKDYFELGLLYLQNEFPKKYTQLMDTIEELFPNDVQTQFLYGMAYFFERNNQKALKCLVNAQKLGFQTDLLYNTLGSIYSRQRRFNLAQKMYLNAIDINPQYEIALYNLGVLSLYQNQYSNAEHYFLKSSYYKPEYVKPYIAFGQMIDFPEFYFSKYNLGKIVLAIAPHNPEIPQLIENMEITDMEFERIANMSFSNQDLIKKKLIEIWKPFQAPESDFEETFKHRRKLYKALIDFSYEI